MRIPMSRKRPASPFIVLGEPVVGSMSGSNSQACLGFICTIDPGAKPVPVPGSLFPRFQIDSLLRF